MLASAAVMAWPIRPPEYRVCDRPMLAPSDSLSEDYELTGVSGMPSLLVSIRVVCEGNSLRE